MRVTYRPKSSQPAASEMLSLFCDGPDTVRRGGESVCAGTRHLPSLSAHPRRPSARSRDPSSSWLRAASAASAFAALLGLHGAFRDRHGGGGKWPCKRAAEATATERTLALSNHMRERLDGGHGHGHLGLRAGGVNQLVNASQGNGSSRVHTERRLAARRSEVC